MKHALSTPPAFVPPGWYILCRARTLGHAPVRLQFGGQALVAFRCADGTVGVLEDRCAHRAVPLSGGKVCGQQVQCPYHGWEYDIHGKVTLVPAMAQCPGSWQGIGIGAWPAIEQQGFIWIRHEAPAAGAVTAAGTGAGAVTEAGSGAAIVRFAGAKAGHALGSESRSAAGCALATPHSELPPAFAHLPLPGPVQATPAPVAALQSGWTHFVMQTRFQATVEACLENFLDCPHATFVHRYWFRAPTQKRVKAVVRTREDGAEAEFFEEPREKSLVWWLLAPKNGSMRHVDRFIAPNTSRVDYEFPSGLHYIITSSCTPLSPAETMVYTVMSFRYKWLGWLVRLFFEPLSRWIIRQDAAMLASQQQNLAMMAAPGGPPTAPRKSRPNHGPDHDPNHGPNYSTNHSTNHSTAHSTSHSPGYNLNHSPLHSGDHSPDRLPASSPFCSTDADLLGRHIVQWRKALLHGEAPPAAGHTREVEIML